MKKIRQSLFLTAIVIFYSCSQPPEKPLTFTLLQLNDVYEIAPLSGGKEGGMARVAWLRKELMKKDSNLITVLSGDFVSPSLMGTLSYQGEAIAGKQMVEVMNETGVDYVTFGNHEFDIKLWQLRKRINESEFEWISSNVFYKAGTGDEPFIKIKQGKKEPIMPYTIRTLNFREGKMLKAGIIGATLDFNKNDSVFYDDVYASVKRTYEKIKEECDMIFAITHLEMDMDKRIASEVPGLNLIMGGHEHENMKAEVGNVTITKADANAKSVYIHTVTFYPSARKTSIQSDLKMISEELPFDEQVKQTVDRWNRIADSSIKSMGYDPADKLMVADPALDGREATIRSRRTNYTDLIVKSLVYAWPQADVALFNSGSLRVDDELEGTVSQYDILRSLPFGGALTLIKLDGKALTEVLNIGTTQNVDNGGYLQIAKAERSGNEWLVNGKKIDPAKKYTVFMPLFVAQGKEKGLDMLKTFSNQVPAKLSHDIRNDIRDAVIAYIKSGMQEPLWKNGAK